MYILFLLDPLHYLRLVEFAPKGSSAYLALAQADPPGLLNSLSKTEYTVNCDLPAAEALHDLATRHCREALPAIEAAIAKSSGGA
ncbi:MAG TPA: hypothetical protein VGL11_25700 [Candidatus Binatia bacterium]